MKNITLTLCLFSLIACTKEQPQKVAQSPVKLEVSSESCFKNCSAYQKVCSNLKTTNEQCSKESSASCDLPKAITDIESVDIFHMNSCKEACWNVSNHNPIEICEQGDPTNFKTLTNDVMSTITRGKLPHLKALQLSNKLFKTKNPLFTKNYNEVMSVYQPSNLPTSYLSEEKDQVSDHHLEFWLKRKTLKCLSKATLKKLTELAQHPSSNGLYINATKLQKNIFKDCSLKNLTVHDKKPFSLPKKATKLIYHFKDDHSGDCGYPIPRIEIQFTKKIESDSVLILNSEFKPLTKTTLVKTMNETPKLYNSDLMPFDNLFSYRGKKYFITPVPSMALSYNFYELTEHGPVLQKQQSVWQEPCGS